MRLLIDLSIAFLTIGLVEAVVKPVAKRWVKRRIMAAAPAVLDMLDAQMPDLLRDLTGDQLETVVREKLEAFTGEPWGPQAIDQVFALYDPRITANRLPVPGPAPES